MSRNFESVFRVGEQKSAVNLAGGLVPTAEAQCQRFKKAFGERNGRAWFAEGLTFSQAMERHKKLQRSTR